MSSCNVFGAEEVALYDFANVREHYLKGLQDILTKEPLFFFYL